MDDTEIFLRQSDTLALLSICASASAVMPVMAFIGVRISWLMEERKSLLARFASSAAESAFSSAALFFRSDRIRSVTSARTRHTVR